MSYPSAEHDFEFDPAVTAWFVPPGRSTYAPIEVPVQSPKSRSRQLHELSLMLHQPDEPDTEPQLQKPLETNQRQYARCPLPQESVTARLNLNGRKLVCQLVELSIGGFGVVVQGKPNLSAGAIGLLSAPGMNFIVSVSRQEERSDGVYIGLKQIEEVLDDHPFSRAGRASPLGYAIAAFSGAMIATVAYFFMRGQ
ncbi:PilZ domain-containing protein [Schlesneria paludicola]|uniref:PilZ domain-containing protein n=1 Tax=Schlesneria paludicola TaxID=360056 RepID=UPI000299D844|nr:PilZ domain-containing protein [Schlesneria paludicola]